MPGLPYVGPDAANPRDLVTLGQADARYQQKTGATHYWNISYVVDTNQPSFSTTNEVAPPSTRFTYLGTKPSNLVNMQGSGGWGAKWKGGDVAAVPTAPWGIKFHASNTRYVELMVAPLNVDASMRIWIDGVEDQLLPRQFPTMQQFVFNTVLIDLGEEPRPSTPEIRIEFSTNVLLGKVWVEPDGVISPAPVEGPRWLFLGDSLTEGESQNTGGELGSYVGYMSRFLGADDIWNGGVRGSGPNKIGNNGMDNYQGRAWSDIVPAAPEYVAIAGWFNDRSNGSTPEQVATAIGNTIDGAKSITPAPAVIVFGSPDPGTGSNATEWGTFDSAIAAVCADRDVPYVAMTDWVRPEMADWFFGSDDLHPSDLGHQYLAVRVWSAIATELELDGAGVDWAQVQQFVDNGIIASTPVIQQMIDAAVTAGTDGLISTVDGDTRYQLKGTTPQTKLMTWTCGGLDQVVALSATSRSSMGGRIPVRTLEPTKRWRVKIRNYGVTSGAKTPLNGNSIIYGRMFGDGNFATGATYTLEPGPFTVPGDGTFYYSPWVTEPENQLSPDFTALIGWGWTTASNIVLQGMEAKWWFTNTAAQAIDTSYTGQSIQNMYGMPADFQIEYEVATTRPSGLWVGDSISAGIVGPPGVSQNSNVLQYWWESYPNLWADYKRTIINNISGSGWQASTFANSMEPWTRVDHIGAGYDFGVVALGTNDFMFDTTAGFQANMAVVLQRMRDWCGLAGKPIYLLGPTTRNQGNDARRQEIDAWLATQPLSTAGYVNLQTAIAATQASTAWTSGFSSDGVHPSYQGKDRLLFRVLQTLTLGSVDYGLPARNNDIFKVVTQAQYDAMAGGRDPNVLYLIRG